MQLFFEPKRRSFCSTFSLLFSSLDERLDGGVANRLPSFIGVGTTTSAVRQCFNIRAIKSGLLKDKLSRIVRTRTGNFMLVQYTVYGCRLNWMSLLFPADVLCLSHGVLMAKASVMICVTTFATGSTKLGCACWLLIVG